MDKKSIVDIKKRIALIRSDFDYLILSKNLSSPSRMVIGCGGQPGM
jgi:hypothetical protein